MRAYPPDRQIVVAGGKRRAINHLPASGLHRFELVTPGRRRVTTEIGRMAGLAATAFARIPRRVAGVIPGRIAVDSGNNGDEGGSGNGVVTPGFALYY